MRNTILKRTLALFLVFVLAFTSLNLDWNLQTVSADTESSTENTAVAVKTAADVSPYYFDESDNVFRTTTDDAIVSVYYTDSNEDTITLDKECTVYYVLTGSETSEYYKSEYLAYVDVKTDTEITSTLETDVTECDVASSTSVVSDNSDDVVIFDVNAGIDVYLTYPNTDSDAEPIKYWKELDLWRVNDDITNTVEPIINSTFINEDSNYRLTGDTELQSSLIISSGVTANIDLNGYVLSFADEYKEAAVEGTILYVKGTLNIYDSRGR
ncbi:MAG: hypothetical protein R3Y45_05145 [Bacillota bacterium]